MRIAFIAILVVGLGIAGFAAYLVMQQFNVRDQQLQQLAGAAQTQKQIPLSDVVIATDLMTYGQSIDAERLKVIKWPTEFLPEGAFSTVEELAPTDPAKQREVIRRIEKFEPILAVKITDAGENAGIASLLSPGMRAFTIRVDVATGVSGFLTPGDKVDVFWSGTSVRGKITRLIIEDLQLIAVDQIADKDRNRPVVARTITVEATPQVAATLAQAQSTGDLSLSLRGAEDSSTFGALQVNVNDLVGIIEEEPKPEPKPEVKPEPEPEPAPTIRIRKGNQVTIVPAN